MATIYDVVVLAKAETVKGTDSVPTGAANAVRVKSVKLTKNQTIIDRPAVKQSMGNLAHLIGKETVSCELVVELRGSGTAGTAPEWDALAKACRLAATIVAATSVTYAPQTATDSSATIYVYQDGLLWKLLGAVGTCKMSASIDGVVLATYSMQASYAVPTAVAAITNAVYLTSQPLVMSNATTVSDGTTISVGSFGMDLGNDVQNHYTTSENSFVVVNRKPTINFNKDSVATVAEWTALTNGTTVSFSAAFGSVAGNRVSITAPVAKRSAVAYNTRAERNTLDVTYNLFESTSNDQFSIALT